MKLSWQTRLAGVACAGLFGIGAWLPAQERSGQERSGQERAPRATAKQAADEIRANDCHVNIIDKVTIPAARGGVLGVVNCEVGMIIKAGELVAKVKDEVALAQFMTAQTTASNDIEIQFAEKSAEVAQVEYAKALRSNAVLANTVTDIELRRLKLNYEKAELQKLNAKKDHEVAGCKRDEADEILKTHMVAAPMNGLVTKLYKRTGDGVREGEAVLEVVNTDRMRVSGYVPFKERGRLQVGDLVRVQILVGGNDPLPEEDEVFEGKITFIDAAVQKVKPEVRIYAEVTNRNGILCDGLTCSMRIYPGKTLTPAAATSQRGTSKRAVVGQ
jgi:membrane fusion protein (multidrug efflux system)